MAIATPKLTDVEIVDLASTELRDLNRRLHEPGGRRRWRIVNPNGAHAVACGLDVEIEVEIEGHVGYYCAGMNKLATVHVNGNAGTGVAENMMSGTVVVRGSVGHMSAFMAQTGRLVVCGDAGEALGDSIYEAHLYVRGEVASLGADCVEKEMREHHVAELRTLLDRAGFDDVDPAEFKRYGSARRLYNFKIDNAGAY
jgi:methylamine---glutamate N-methyltransferase subunit B